jgi:CheY-like chemotaxis protein
VEAVLDGALKPSDLAETLAQVLGRRPAKAPVETASPGIRMPARKLRVLLVEDNHVNQRVAARMVKNIGHEVDLAADGFEAVAQVQARAYDVVLMDMQMPRMDGLQATRIIRGLSGDAGRVPIVAMTANAFASDRDACFEAGMDDFVSKPVTRDKLFGILEHCGGKVRRDDPAPEIVSPPAAPLVVDKDQFEALKGELGEDILGELLGSFWEGTGHLLRQLRAAIDGHDWPAADEVAHRLKGSAATLSFAAVAEACERLRNVLRAGATADIGPALAALLDGVRDSQAFIQDRGGRSRDLAA